MQIYLSIIFDDKILIRFPDNFPSFILNCRIKFNHKQEVIYSTIPKIT